MIRSDAFLRTFVMRSGNEILHCRSSILKIGVELTNGWVLHWNMACFAGLRIADDETKGNLCICSDVDNLRQNNSQLMLEV